MIKNGPYDIAGATMWFEDDVLHRVDGPAVEHPSGREVWYHLGEIHRKDGPAIIHPDGTEEWFYCGRRVDPLVVFCLERNPCD